MDTAATIAGSVTTTNGMAIEETDRLIASDKVEGTAVYNRQDVRLGTVHNFMVDKSTGRVAYAVMSFGGFLGMGESYHPLPWRVLTYDTRRGGFVVDLDRSRLEKAPSYTTANTPNWSNRTYGIGIDEFYGLTPYWGMI
jgi:PRC-barrel domain